MTMKGGTARNVALMGPCGAGKTTLLESLLAVGEADGHKPPHDAPETPRDYSMGTELGVAHLDYDGVAFTFLDCPGSPEFCYEARAAIAGIDLAIVVVEPILERLVTAAPVLHWLDAQAIPHIVFINKMDRSETRYRDLLGELRRLSARPVVPHLYAIGRGETLVGTIDLVTEQAFAFRAGQPAMPMPMPEEYRERGEEARAWMLETLADHDDDLMEQLILEQRPDEAAVMADLCRTLQADQVVPVLCGVALKNMGVRRLLAVLAKETPAPSVRAAEHGFATEGPPILQVLKNWHLPHVGKLSLARIWQGAVSEGDTIDGMRINGLCRLQGKKLEPVTMAEAGTIVALGRLEEARTGDVLGAAFLKEGQALPQAAPPPPMFKQAVRAASRNDEVKLSAAFAKLVDEDPSLRIEHDTAKGQILLMGQGELHLRTALERLRQRFNLALETMPPRTAYCETIRTRAQAHGRHKKQSGGHGQFGDVKLEIEPLARGAGFTFTSRIVGGSVPRQYVPAVEAGARESLMRGPLGFPVVDIAITLADGQHHSVDSNELSFKMATGLALREGLPRCQPVLLEPIEEVSISVPTECTSRTLQLISSKRGQILGYAAMPGWPGWDRVEAHLPESELADLILTLRALTQGVGFFECQFDHLQEVPERLAQTIVSQATA